MVIPRDAISLQAGRNHSLRFHGLLVKASTFAAPAKKSVGTDGDKMPELRISALQIRQPTEKLKARLSHQIILQRLAAEQQGLR